MPVATAKFNAGERRRASDVGQPSLDVKRRPESLDGSAVDWAVVNRKPVRGKRPFRDYHEIPIRAILPS